MAFTDEGRREKGRPFFSRWAGRRSHRSRGPQDERGYAGHWAPDFESEGTAVPTELTKPLLSVQFEMLDSLPS